MALSMRSLLAPEEAALSRGLAAIFDDEPFFPRRDDIWRRAFPIRGRRVGTQTHTVAEQSSTMAKMDEREAL
jgi:hypothetical protein